MNDLVFIHHDNNTDQTSVQEFLSTLQTEQYVSFKTCLREIHFFNLNHLSLDQEKELKQLSIHQGEKALDFLINLLCGFKSRVLGETEIFGQFKKFYESHDVYARAKFLHPQTMRFVFESVKELREKHIRLWGCHSYGSVIRKLIRDYGTVDLVGFGHLSQEIMPWLEQKSVTAYVRSPEKVRVCENTDQYTNLKKLEALHESAFSSEVLILAAPVLSEQILAKIESSSQQIKVIIDCRALDENIVSLRQLTSANVVELKDLFSSLESEQVRLEEKVNFVKALISEKVCKYVMREVHRPQGWDDLQDSVCNLAFCF